MSGEDFLKTLDKVEEAYRQSLAKRRAQRDDSMDNYRGPGWYVVRRLGFDEKVWTGPYSQESTCNTSRPPNDEGLATAYKCEYFGQ